MRKQYTSKQIAAHIADNHLNNGRDTDFIASFEKDLEKRIPVLRKSGDRECYLNVCSLLYCVRDMRGSCRDAGENLAGGDRRESERFLNRAAKRIREMGQLLVDIKNEYPDEYDRSCRGFVDRWRETEFERGRQFLNPAENSPERKPEQEIKQKTMHENRPAAQALSLR